MIIRITGTAITVHTIIGHTVTTAVHVEQKQQQPTEPGTTAGGKHIQLLTKLGTISAQFLFLLFD